jgi:hypothetical protein
MWKVSRSTGLAKDTCAEVVGQGVVRGSEIRDMTATSALRRLDEEARAIDPSQDESTAAQRGHHFYTMLQDLQDSPFRGMGLPSREEIDAILKVQKKEDSTVKARIRGRHTNPSSAYDDGPPGSPRRPAQEGQGSADGAGPGGQMRMELGRYATHVDVALGLTRHWTLNKLQSMAVLLPAALWKIWALGAWVTSWADLELTSAIIFVVATP